MHNLALDLLKKGHKVTGSDDEIFEPSYTRLKDANILPEKFGWYPEKINENIDVVIVGMHARPDNPELLKVKELGIKYYSYPEFLYEHSKNKKRIVIAGSHGKTTTTSIILHVLKESRMKFDYLVGAQIDGFDRMVSISDDAPIMIFEGDEYLTAPFDPRPKFHLYKPHIALITGIAWDHINVFETFDKYVEQFRIFIELIEPNGTLVWYEGDNELQKLSKFIRNNIKSIPYNEHKAITVNKDTYLLINDNEKLKINLFGKHNLQNINGAKIVCNELGISDSEFYNAIKTFRGASKRLQKIGFNKENNITFFLDFAHSPSKVKATIEAIKSIYKNEKLIACLELHTYSSLQKDFLKQYSNTMDLADVSLIYFNPKTLELKKKPILNESDIIDGFNNSDIKVFTDSKQLFSYLKTSIYKNSVVLLMSSGNFDNFNINEWIKSFN